ncbi:MAG: gliding motility-associated ABC transporter substrate-binding protein GldG [Paludibacteraceae bacterium]|nr:gliding motility-associated ABC transporter substrate-binding protein GldG [Paludibacteraceae bacterium]
MIKKYYEQFIVLLIILILLVLSFSVIFRIDLSSDKRYSISEPTKSLLKSARHDVNIEIYLDGDLNPGFQRLKISTRDLLKEMSVYAARKIHIGFNNPSKASSETERMTAYELLERQGMSPTAIYERDKEGKAIQKIIFPWIKISYGGKSVIVNLLKNIRGNSGEENLNISIENLEYEIADGLRRVISNEVSRIAFLEGHGELNEAQTYSASKLLSRYFQIDRGVLANDAKVLDAYKAVIVAGPTTAFSESDKYILDQYIMRGGRVLWLLDGVRMASEELSVTGVSPAIELNLNLSDMFFKYGVRIVPVLLQDVQSVQVPLNIAPAGEQPQFEPAPFFYAPLLLASYQHPITRNIPELKSAFASAIETVGENSGLIHELLLATSDNTHIINVPTTIDMSESPDAKDKNYFNAAYVPVAMLSEGEFSSNFANRMTPPELKNTERIIPKSVNTRQIFVADADIIRNETNGIASDSTTLPVGFDRYMNRQFGNPDFIRNAVLYLTDDEGWLDLRARTLRLRLLNKNIVNEQLLFWQIINTVVPVFFVLLAGLLYQRFRKKRYTK